jgi:LPXTG-motif cell wall-anchored protein
MGTSYFSSADPRVLRESITTTRIPTDAALGPGRSRLLVSRSVPCELPVTGANISMLVTAGFLLVALGVAVLLLIRRRGLCRAVGIVITVAVGATVLTFSVNPRADADSCTSTTPSVAAAVATTTTTTADTPITGSSSPIVTSPGEALPEASQVAALPAIAMLVMSVYIVMRFRRNQADTP